MGETFLNKVRQIVLSNLADEKYGVSNLASDLGLSRSQVLRKIKAESGKSVNQLIREIRLEEGAKLLKSGELTASEIAYQVGFSSPSYFNKCFLDKYGVTPGEYKRSSESGEDTAVSNGEYKIKKRYRKSFIAALLIVFVALAGYITILTGKKATGSSSLSIAVLPFSDYSEDQDKEYLADGLTEAINLELAKNKSLRVISRGSAMKYKDTKMLYPHIAKELGADLLVEGSLFSTEDSVSVVVQLIEPFPKEKHLWQNYYDQDHSNYFGLVRNVSAEIAGEISTAVRPEENKDEKHRVDPEVYDLYLRGKHIWNYQKTRDSSLFKAIGYLDQAIDKDPGFAPAYVTLAESYLALNSLTGDNEERLKNRKKARMAVDKALDLDQTLAEAYITKGNIAGKSDWDWERMKQLAVKALEIEPSNSSAHIALADYYTIRGNYRKAINETLKAEILDPVNPAVGYKIAKLYYIAGEFEKSIQKYTEVIELNPDYGWAYDGLGFAWLQAGDTLKAVKTFQKLQVIMGNDALGQCYNEHSFEDCLHLFLENASRNTPRFCSSPVLISEVYMILNEQPGALEYLDIALQYKNEDLPVMITYPDFIPLHNNPEFQKIAQKIGVIFLD